PQPRAMGQGAGDRHVARPGAVPRPRLPGLRRRAGGRRLRGAAVRRRHDAGVPVELVLEVVLALRRARRRAERGERERRGSVERIHARAPGADFSFVLAQRGMFSYSGLSKAQVQRLRAEYSIYAIDTGRICVAALNSKNVDYVADAIAKVIE